MRVLVRCWWITHVDSNLRRPTLFYQPICNFPVREAHLQERKSQSPLRGAAAAGLGELKISGWNGQNESERRVYID